MGQLVKTLINDLSETGCDSLVVVYYRREDKSRFAELVKDGAKILKYNSGEEFRSSLWKIVSPVASERKAAAYAIFSCNEVEDDEQNEISEDNPESTEEIQTWFQKITDSPHADEKAKIIQYWFRSALIRKQKPCKYVRDTTLDKIYNDISNFCNDASHWEAAKRLKGKRVVRNLPWNRYQRLKNAVQHEKANVEWLENELQKTNNTINNVLEWIDECKTVIK
ncbi:14844_t:CDS:2 [Racocetra persica]|uniref:14844_t:CDS:1 n=1 Tax=Racocetra persica TaxID=160502 RepID=A0ACA9L062_9GLOM|nr:14844_t:CDS:2 [Racocetra persica]